MEELVEFLDEVLGLRNADKLTDSLYRSCIRRELEDSDLDQNYIRLLKNKYLEETTDV